jgi:hypothetical protein
MQPISRVWGTAPARSTTRSLACRVSGVRGTVIIQTANASAFRLPPAAILGLLGLLAGCQLVAELHERSQGAGASPGDAGSGGSTSVIGGTGATGVAGDIDATMNSGASGAGTATSANTSGAGAPTKGGATGGSAVTTGGSAVTTGGSAVTTGGSAVTTGGSAVTTGGSAATPGGSAATTGGSAVTTGGSGGTEAGGGLGGGAAGGSGTGSGEAGAGGAAGALGSACSELGAKGCNGTMSRQQLLCDPTFSRWVANGSCHDDEYCDSESGDCKVIIPECSQANARDLVCVSGELRRCGPDLVTSEGVDTCDDLSSPGCERCRAVVITDAQASPWTVTVAQSGIYWSTETAIVGSGLDGSDAAPRVESLSYPYQFVLAADQLYWPQPSADGKSDTLWSAGTDGSSAHTVATSQQMSNFDRIAVRGSSAYWSHGNPWVIDLVSLPDGQLTPVATNGTDDIVVGLALNDTSVFWVLADSGVVSSAPLAGGTTKTLATGLAHPRGIALDADYVYWSVASGAGIMRVAMDGTAFAQVNTEVIHADTFGVGLGEVAVAVDDSYVYWTVPTANVVMKVAKGGGPSIVVSPGAQPEGLALDATHVYWTNFADGTLMRIAK